MSNHLQVRRAKRGDLGAIISLVREATESETIVGEAEAAEWLLSKGLWIAVLNDALVGIAACQVENLVSVTDVFSVFPTSLLPQAGSRLLATIEGEACTLMCETSVVVLPAKASEALQEFFQQLGYQSRRLEDLPGIWREVLGEFVNGGSDLMVKPLRDRMVVAPL